MTHFGLLLDVVSLFLLLSYTASLFTALLPVAQGDVFHRERVERRRLFAPAFLAALAIALGFWPAVRSVLFGIPDHCLETTGHGPHLCWVHAAGAIPGAHLHDSAALVTLSVLAALIAWHLFAWGQALGRLRLLDSAAVPAREAEVRERMAQFQLYWEGPITVVAFGAPVCFVRGVARPHLVLSTEVLDTLPNESLRAMLAHEVAHVSRADNLWRVAGQAALLTHVPGIGRRAYGRWAEAAEAACDAAAADQVGSRFTVAEALVHFQRMINRQASGPKLGAAFGGSGGLERRVALLLDPPEKTSWHVWSLQIPILGGLLALWQVETLHNGLEGLLGLLHL